MKRKLDKNNIQEIIFGSTSAKKKEYFRLTATKGPGLGKGESACLAYCLYNYDVIGSSNTRDIKNYCNEHDITFLTTTDFLFYAIKRELLTKDQAHSFIKKVRSLGSYPPVVDFEIYICSKLLP